MDTRDATGRFLPGNPGGPGAQNGKRRKVMTDALMIALTEAADDGDRTKARAIADQLVRKAMDGDTQAIALAFDRTEGRSVQTIAGDEERPLRVIQRTIVDPR